MTYQEMCQYIVAKEGFQDWEAARTIKSRKSGIMTARQICFYLASIFFYRLTWTEIAGIFNLNHSTAIHSVKAISDRRETERRFNSKIEGYIKEINSMMNPEEIILKVQTDKELAEMLFKRIDDLKLLAETYCSLTGKKMIEA